MKAMILAAGLGTRLRPLTDNRPKALVEVGGRTLLEITLARLREFGVRDVVVNAHHFAGQIVEYLKANNNFGMHVEVSREETLLDTGGGLKKAAWFLLNDNASDEPFLLHNVDVVSTIDFAEMTRFHHQHRALATLAIQKRNTSRPLLFNQQWQLVGRGTDGEEKPPEASLDVEAMAFSGIHVISPRIFSMMSEEGAFSIIDCYLCLGRKGEKIIGFRADSYYWRDVGTPESVAKTDSEMREKLGV